MGFTVIVLVHQNPAQYPQPRGPRPQAGLLPPLALQYSTVCKSGSSEQCAYRGLKLQILPDIATAQEGGRTVANKP